MAGPSPAVVPAYALEPIELHAQPVPLQATEPGRTRVGRLTYRGGLRLTSPASIFGGLSALHVDDDGRRLLAVTDQGHWLSARLSYGADGTLIGVHGAEMAALGDTLGQPLVGKVNQDAESLAQLVDGTWIVGYERRHRLWRYPAGPELGAAGAPLQTPRDMFGAPPNGGIEALATLRDGRLVALCEELLVGRGVRGFVREGRRWRRFVYSVEGLARPSDATGLPSGDLLVIDRGYSPDAGVTVRVRRVPARELRKNAVVVGETLAQIERPLTVDNFEGVAARRAPGGETLIYLLSDDNFSAEQRTLLLMFAIDEEEKARGATGFTPGAERGGLGAAAPHPPARRR
jgi:hypothetical protein